MFARVVTQVARPLSVLAMSASLASTAAAQFGTNLVVNGGAESNESTGRPTSWSVTGNGTVVQYAVGSGFPTAASPGSPTRGAQFFSGGEGAETSVFSQQLSLSAFSGTIAAGRAGFTLSAWLGGFSSQRDNATFSASFLGSNGQVLQAFTLGPVSVTDRASNTGMLQRVLTGVVPTGSLNVLFTLTMTRLDGTYNDGYADDLSFALNEVAGPPPTTPPVPGVVPEPASVVLMGTGLGLLGIITRRRTRRA